MDAATGRVKAALVCSEAVRPKMAGIGIRYLEFARRLPAQGVDVVLISPAAPAETASLGLDLSSVRLFAEGRLSDLTADCDCVIAQGHLANAVVSEVADKPVVIDLYDPFLIENLSYFRKLGEGVFRNDHATWMHQLGHGDFFLCSSEEQRLFYMGFLTALGRLNPPLVEEAPDLRELLGIVPFGVPATLPDYTPYLPPRTEGVRRILFGGIYDWYDPWTTLRALEEVTAFNWEILFVHNPNPDGTPQALAARVEEYARNKGWLGERVKFIGWVPAERRFDLLRDVDALVATHTVSVETRLSLRTRFLEALAAECPVVTSEGGALARLITEHDTGFAAPAEDAHAVRVHLERLFGDPRFAERQRENGLALASKFHWDSVLTDLVSFCKAPRKDPHKSFLAAPPPSPLRKGLARRLYRALARRL